VDDVRDGPLPGCEPWWGVARAVASGIVVVLAFGCLAAGMWRSRPTEWPDRRRAATIGLAVVIAGAMAGPFAALATSNTPLDDVIDVLDVALFTLGLVGTGALAVAAIRAAPQLWPIPEMLIAGGAAANAVVLGVAWWLLADYGQWWQDTPLEPVGRAILGVTEPIVYAAMLLLATGFASGALLRPVVRSHDRRATLDP
jgi:hypothetical protein